MLLFGPLTEYLDMSKGSKDESGLGQWVVMTLRGSDGITTREVCGYNPCGNNKLESSTTNNTDGSLCCPRVRFREDLINFLTRWRSAGNKLIVCLDANENIYRKSLGKALTNSDTLAMKEVVSSFTGKQIGPTTSVDQN